MVELRAYFCQTYYKHEYYVNMFQDLLTWRGSGDEFWIYDEQDAIDKFKEDYISYSQALDETIATSCKTDPDKFYRELEKTRIARKKLNEDYKKTNEILNQHKTKVKELMESL